MCTIKFINNYLKCVKHIKDDKYKTGAYMALVDTLSDMAVNDNPDYFELRELVLKEMEKDECSK